MIENVGKRVGVQDARTEGRKSDITECNEKNTLTDK